MSFLHLYPQAAVGGIQELPASRALRAFGPDLGRIISMPHLYSIAQKFRCVRPRLDVEFPASLFLSGLLRQMLLYQTAVGGFSRIQRFAAAFDSIRASRAAPQHRNPTTPTILTSQPTRTTPGRDNVHCPIAPPFGSWSIDKDDSALLATRRTNPE